MINTSMPPDPFVHVDKDTAELESCQGDSFFSKKNHKRNDYFEIYENCVIFTPQKRKFPSKFKLSSKRGLITEFSNRSRFRLFVTMAKVKHINSEPPIFVTLTYHHNYNNFENTHRSDLHNFLVQMRNLFPNLQYIWRLEYQKRGAPHFHFIFFPQSMNRVFNLSKFIQSVTLLWHNISEPDSKAHLKYGVKIDRIDSYSKACAYISKYLAKVDDCVTKSISGRQWGSSWNLPTPLKSDISCVHKESKIIIERLRKWLLQQGRSKYATDIFFHAGRPQVIFIDELTFFDVIKDNQRVKQELNSISEPL